MNNLLEQIPQEYRARACRECYGQDDYDFERNLIPYVLWRKWETYPHPVDLAQAVEREIDERIDTGLFVLGDTYKTFTLPPDNWQDEDEQLKQYFGKVQVTTSAKWRKRHLWENREEQEEARKLAAAWLKGERG